MQDAKVIKTKLKSIRDFKISFSETSNRKTDSKLETQAKEEWKNILENAQKSGLKPWDGTYYRLENLNELEKGSQILKISTVKYSQLRAFQKLEVSKNYPTEYHTLHISTLGIVITSDNHYIFGFRERSLNNTKITFIGGGLQPDELEVKKAQDIETNMLKEIREEINVDSSLIDKTEFNKIVHAIERMNIFIIFDIKLKISRDEVLELFENIKDKEHDRLIFVKDSDIKQFSKNLPYFMQLAINS